MKKYPKIQSIFKRDEQTHRFIEGQYSMPEFEYLKDLEWTWTEKIDGTNIRVIWDGQHVEFRGRGDRSHTPPHLLEKLKMLFPPEKFKQYTTPMCLYGEGYGYKIQKGGKYIEDDVSFILFDVLIDNIWLRFDDALDIAVKLDILIVPIVGYGTLNEAITKIKSRTLQSRFGDFLMEGLVLKPRMPLLKRNGDRIITKVKHVDYAT